MISQALKVWLFRAHIPPPKPNIMAIKLSANYSKKIGLPQYSSHSFSASVEVELTDISQVEQEIQKLYELLQHSVDQEIQNVGFIPSASNGHASNSNARTYQLNGNGRQQANGHQQPRTNGDSWNCTDGQRGFILRIISDNKMDKQEAEDLSIQLFGIGVKQLNKMQASQLIEDLLVKVGKPATRQTRWQPQPTNRQAA
jgi:hypothetical protein